MDDLVLVLITGPLSALVGAIAATYAQSLKEWWGRPKLYCHCIVDDEDYYQLHIENRGKSTAENVDIHISYVDPCGCDILHPVDIVGTYINPHSSKNVNMGQFHHVNDTLVRGNTSVPSYAEIVINVSAKGIIEKELRMNVHQFVGSNHHVLNDKTIACSDD